MQRPTSYADFIKEWEDLLAPLVENAGELPQLEIPREKLQGLLEDVRTYSQQQAAFTASKQETSRRLEGAISQGRRLATLLRTSLKEHYGVDSEKLMEFRIQPFRGRIRKTQEIPPPPPPVEIASS